MSDEADVRRAIRLCLQEADACLATGAPLNARDLLTHLRMAQAALEAAHAEPDDDERAEFARVFSKWFALHPPVEYISTEPMCPDDGPTEPHKVRQYDFDGLYEEFVAAGFCRRGTNAYQSFGTPATVEQVADVVHEWMPGADGYPDSRCIGKDIHARYLVLNREPTASPKGERS